MNLNEFTEPSAPDAEKSLLSMAMIAPKEIMPAAIADEVGKSFFFVPAHQLLWGALESIYNDKQDLDIVSVMQHLKDNNLFDAIGGLPGFNEIKSYDTRTCLYSKHFEILQEMKNRRKAFELARLAADTSNNLYQEAGRELAVSFAKASGSETLSFTDKVSAAMKDIQERVNSGSHITGIRTGFKRLDILQGGLRPGELIIAGARPAMGKSVFGMNIALAAARQCKDTQKGRVLFVSLEMSWKEIIERLAQSIAKVNVNALASSKDNGVKVEKNTDLMRAQKELSSLPMDIVEMNGADINRIILRLEAEHRKGALSLVVVDYIQLIQGSSKGAKGNAFESISEVSIALKNIARRLNIPVLALAQVNRDAASSGASGKAPTLAQLKGSGSLEQDADSVILLHRKGYYNNSDNATGDAESDSTIEIHLAKNRHGITGNETADFIGKYSLIESQTDTP